MGKQAMGINLDSGMGAWEWEWEHKGPWPNAKSRSLKLASHEMKKEVRPQRWIVVRLRGSRRKRDMTGRIERSLVVPLGMKLAMKWQ